MRSRSLTTTFTIAGLAASAWAGPASAQTTACFSATQIPAGLNFFEVEGPLSAYDFENRTMTTLGVTVRFPDPAPGETFEFDVGGGMFTSFADLVDPDNEAIREILGDPTPRGTSSEVARMPATIIAIGSLVDNNAGCAELVADEGEFLYGEHVTVGPLTEVDLAAGTFSIGGVKVLMSDDPRVPSQLLDASGNDKQVDLNYLAREEFRGSIAGGDGFMEHGILRGFIIETSAFRRRGDGRENVIVEVARWGEDGGELRAVGFVTLDGTVQPAATHVEIYTGSGSAGLEFPFNPDGVSDGVTCTGTLRGRAALVAGLETPGAKEFTYRREGVPEPENICVRTVVRNANGSFSAHGASGSNSRGVDLR